GARLLFVPYAADREDRARPAVEATTGADGRFRLTAPRNGLVRGRQLVAAADGLGPDWVGADGLAGKDVTLRLGRDLPVAGRVLDLEGRPVKGAVVRVHEVKATPGEDLTAVLKDWEPDSNSVSRLLTKQLDQPTAVVPVVRTDAEGRFRLRGLGRER